MTAAPTAAPTPAQAAAIERVKAMKLLPFKPRAMRWETRLRQWARVAWVLSLVFFLSPLLGALGLYTPPREIALVLALAGLGAWMAAGPVGRREARRLVLARRGLVCPACHYDLDCAEGQGICPECATVFDLATVVDVWRWAYRLRELARPGAEDLVALVSRKKAGRVQHARPGESAKDASDEQPQ